MEDGFDFLEDYKKNAQVCKCYSWARCDYFSGFLSAHHAGCEKFSPKAELHLMSREVARLRKELLNKVADHGQN